MFNRLNLSYFATTLGYWIALFFIPLVVLELTGSPLLMSVSYALDTLPYLLFTPIAGVVADKFDKKKLILLGEFCCFLAATVLFLLPFRAENAYLMIFLGFVISGFSAFHHPVFQSILPELYARQELPKVNGDIATISSLTGIIAPAVLGVLFAFLDNTRIALLIPLLYLLSAVSFWGIRYRFMPSEKPVRLISDNLEAVAYLKKQPVLMRYSYLFFFVNFGLRMILAALIWIYTVHFELTKSMAAYHYIFIGVMSIIGAKTAGRYIVGRYSADSVIFYSSAAIALLMFALLAFDHVLYLTFVWGWVSFFSMFIVVAYFTYRQTQTEHALLSRVVALTRLISYLAIAPAVMLSGWLLDTLGNQNRVYAVAGLVTLLPTVCLMGRKRSG
ncbi:MFS transporter [Neisseria leonii]|uniref:MFS transporter n=1 Tax=Neisseria leonii TaxID=2995413 RepID=UPI00237BA62F|nr:MFS transporter [Neisseria sp. 3986]MDD9325333.1 MFS transporter [Neisseria sp. 3986]